MPEQRLDWSAEPTRGESGATSVEYGILIAAIAAAIVGIVITLGFSTSELFNRVATGWP
jgi:Flp pilus assembly pilin Flp